jgi:hypothetical protein
MNPYLQQSANNIATNLTQNWQQNALPSINSGAMMAGGFGGSRQGVAQALSANGLNQAIGQAQTSLYGNAYEGDQNRATQQAMQNAALQSQQSIAGMQNQTQRDLGFGNLDLGRTQAANNYSLGLGNLGLGQTQAQNNYNLGLGQLGLGQYNAETNRGLGYGQLSQQGEQNAFNNQQAGFNSQLNALNALQGWNAQGVGLANQQQQIPLQNLGLLSNIGASIGGQGGSVTQPGASTIGSAAGGALTAAQLWQLLSKGFGG